MKPQRKGEQAARRRASPTSKMKFAEAASRQGSAKGSLSQGRLWINGQLAYSSENPSTSAAGYTVNPGLTVHLNAGQKVSFLLERYNVAVNGISVGWGTTDGSLPMNAIPTSQLYPQ